MNRRKFLKQSSCVTLIPLYSTIVSCSISVDDDTDTDTDTDTDADTSTTTTLNIPPLVEPDSNNQIQLQANDGTTDFYEGVSSITKGFIDRNNDAGTSYLGPTIRVRSHNTNSNSSGTTMVDLGTQTDGTDGADFNAIEISIFNNSSETISSHWHGMHVDGFVDGGPYNAIASGETWVPTLKIYQQAGTNWYHTHIHGTTAEEVYKGLAGMFIVDDANSIALDAAGLPSTYGVDDIPLIIQDKSFNNEVMDSSNVGGRFEGDVFLVNGVVTPNLEVEAGLVRFRILNTSNARFYDFSITDNSVTGNFDQIASDGGFLSSAVNMSSLRMGPGERNEIVIDFSTYNEGDIVNLVSPDNENTAGLSSPFTLMTFTVVAQTSQTASNTIPDTLNANITADRANLIAKTPDAYVYVRLEGGSTPIATIRSTTALTNGFDSAVDTEFDHSRANFVSTSTQTTPGYTEEWHIRGATHPFHLHGCHAMIKTIGGATPSTEKQGWKDVFEVNRGDDVTFLVQFNERAYAAASNAGEGAGSDYMYMMHCHILGHEDNGMMGVFEVI